MYYLSRNVDEEEKLPRQHYLPAAYLARFSKDQNPVGRQRQVVVGDRETRRVFTTAVSNVCGISDFYTLKEMPESPNLIDDIWSSYENQLPFAISQLCEGHISGLLWATVIIPFVAGILARGPDFNTRFENRLSTIGLGEFNTPDNTNFARLMEIQRLRPALMVARWIVLETHAQNIITTDIGFMPFENAELGTLGLAIPLGLNSLLLLSPSTKKVIAYEFEGEWFPTIEYSEISAHDYLTLNVALGKSAQRFLFGPDEDIVRSNLYQISEQPIIPEIEELGFPGGIVAANNEMKWFSLVEILSKWFSR